MTGKVRRAALFVALVLAAGCAPRPPANSSEPTPAAPATISGPKRAIIVANTEVDFLHSSNIGGRPELRLLVNPGLAVLDDRGGLRPVLAEAVPSSRTASGGSSWMAAWRPPGS